MRDTLNRGRPRRPARIAQPRAGAPAPPGPLSLNVEQLRLEKRGRLIISDLDLSVRGGAITWVLGENGAGKSSFLAILAGRERPSAGKIYYHPAIEPLEESIYYHPGLSLPDRTSVHEWTTFAERVAPHSPYRPSLAELPPRIPDVSLPLSSLSTGEGKRLILATVLSKPAPLIILDEPFEHLSRAAREILHQHLADRASDALVFIATNQELPRYADGLIIRFDEVRGVEIGER